MSSLAPFAGGGFPISTSWSIVALVALALAAPAAAAAEPVTISYDTEGCSSHSGYSQTTIEHPDGSTNESSSSGAWSSCSRPGAFVALQPAQGVGAGAGSTDRSESRQQGTAAWSRDANGSRGTHEFASNWSTGRQTGAHAEAGGERVDAAYGCRDETDGTWERTWTNEGGSWTQDDVETTRERSTCWTGVRAAGHEVGDSRRCEDVGTRTTHAEQDVRTRQDTGTESCDRWVGVDGVGVLGERECAYSGESEERPWRSTGGHDCATREGVAVGGAWAGIESRSSGRYTCDSACAYENEDHDSLVVEHAALGRHEVPVR